MARKQVNVLLIEDNPGDARLVSEALAEVSSPKFNLTHVERLDDGLQRLDKEKFDVVLLDLLLADSPRLGTLMEIHDQAARVPVVVLTGLEDPTVGLWVLKEGAQDYLIKGEADAEALKHSLLFAMEKHQAQRPSISA